MYAIQKPCHMPTKSPMRSITATATGHGILLSIMMAPILPARQITEPTERSMLPPVRMQRSIPVPSTNTYAFCEIKLSMLIGNNDLPSVMK